MDYKHIEVYEVLSIENVQVFETFKDSGVLLTDGRLQVLYSKDHNRIFLKINDFNYGLNKKIPLLASSREPGAARAYVLPTISSYYVIQIANGSDMQFSKLDDILRDNSDFAYKEGEKAEGLPIELYDGTVKIRKIKPEHSRANYSLAQLIFDGGNSIERFMVNTAEVITGGMTRLGNGFEATLNPKETEGEEKPLVKAKTVSRWAVVNSASGMSSSMSTSYIKGLLSLGASISQWIAKQLERKEYEKEVEEIREKEKQRVKKYEEPSAPDIESVLKATVHSVFTVWHGMAEALQILTVGLSESTSGVVSRQFGPLAGEVFKAGVGAVSSRVRVPTLPGQKYLRYINRF